MVTLILTMLFLSLTVCLTPADATTGGTGTLTDA